MAWYRRTNLGLKRSINYMLTACCGSLASDSVNTIQLKSERIFPYYKDNAKQKEQRKEAEVFYSRGMFKRNRRHKAAVYFRLSIYVVVRTMPFMHAASTIARDRWI